MGRYYGLPRKAAVTQLWLIAGVVAVVAMVVIVRWSLW